MVNSPEGGTVGAPYGELQRTRREVAESLGEIAAALVRVGDDLRTSHHRGAERVPSSDAAAILGEQATHLEMALRRLRTNQVRLESGQAGGDGGGDNSGE